MKFDAKKTIAALAMSATLFAMPVSALADAAVDSGTAAETPIVTKTWKDNNKPLETANIPFTLTYTGYQQYVGGVASGTVTNNGATMNVNDTKTVALPIADSGLNASQVFQGIEFSAPGDYIFTLQETPNTSKHYTIENTVYTVKVRVVWGTGTDGVTTDTPVVDSVGIYDAAGASKEDSAAFTNTAVDKSVFSLTKVLAGNMADLTDTFEFTVNFSDLQPGATYKYTGSDGVDGGTIIADESGKGTLTVTLGNNESVNFENLPNNATYTVSEGGTLLTNEASAVKIGDYNATMTGADGTLTTGESDAVVVTNTKTATTITGLAVTFLPYIGGLAAAGAGVGALVISRRHKKDADNF